jgi:quinol monooxygenase YgiN
MIRHIVALRFKPETTETEKQALFADLAALGRHIDGILDFKSFQNVSVETPLVRGFRDLFWFDFRDVSVRDAYLVDPEHQAVGARIVAALEGGADGVFVADVEI